MTEGDDNTMRAICFSKNPIYLQLEQVEGALNRWEQDHMPSRNKEIVGAVRMKIREAALLSLVMMYQEECP